jgi:hypothetical protein
MRGPCPLSESAGSTVVGSSWPKSSATNWPIGTIVSILLTGATLLTACGGAAAVPASPTSGTSAQTSSSAAITPTKAAAASADTSGCTLFTAADVSAALGEPVVAKNTFGCEFDSLAQHPFKLLRWIPRDTTPASFEADARKTAADNGGASSFAPVSGLGDAAFSWADDQGSARLDLRKGAKAVEIWVDLGVLGTGDLAAKAQIAKALGAVALNRM